MSFGTTRSNVQKVEPTYVRRMDINFPESYKTEPKIFISVTNKSTGLTFVPYSKSFTSVAERFVGVRVNLIEAEATSARAKDTVYAVDVDMEWMAIGR